MRLHRTSIATGATLAALGGLAAVALSAGAGEPSAAQPNAPATPEIRTETVHRTVRVPPKGSAPSGSTSATFDPPAAAASAAGVRGGPPRDERSGSSPGSGHDDRSGPDRGSGHGDGDHHHRRGRGRSGGDRDEDRDRAGDSGGDDDRDGHGRGRGREDD